MATDPLESARTLLEVLYPGSFTVVPIGMGEVVTTKPEKIAGTALSSAEAAEYLNISVTSLRRMCRRKAITFMKITPHQYRFDLADLDEYKRSRRNKRKSLVQSF